MREILFRGKKFINDEWVEGLFVKDRAFYGKIESHAYIVNHECPSGCFGRDIYFEVAPDTVGQYTGMTDIHGKKIFEGDVVRVECRGIVKAANGCVYFKDGIYMISHVSSALSLFAYRPYCEVIGNIHDNPELMKEG